MRKTKTIFLLAFCCFGLVTHVCSQQNQITRADFIEASETSRIKSWKLSRRLKIKNEYYASDKLTQVETTTTEFIPPDKWHTVTETKIGKKVSLIEFITIGKDINSKKDNGEWRKGGSGFGSGSGIGNIQNEQFTVEKTKFNNQNVKIYESISIYLNSTGQKAYFKISKWINNHDLLIKEEDENGLINPSKIVDHQIEVYEYDPSIKIEAPKN